MPCRLPTSEVRGIVFPGPMWKTPAAPGVAPGSTERESRRRALDPKAAKYPYLTEVGIYKKQIDDQTKDHTDRVDDLVKQKSDEIMSE